MTQAGPKEVYLSRARPERGTQEWTLHLQPGQALGPRLPRDRPLLFRKYTGRLVKQASHRHTAEGLEGCCTLPSCAHPSGAQAGHCSVQTDFHASQVSKQKHLQRQQTPLSVWHHQSKAAISSQDGVSRITWCKQNISMFRENSLISGVQYMHGLESGTQTGKFHPQKTQFSKNWPTLANIQKRSRPLPSREVSWLNA